MGLNQEIIVYLFHVLGFSRKTEPIECECVFVTNIYLYIYIYAESEIEMGGWLIIKNWFM